MVPMGRTEGSRTSFIKSSHCSSHCYSSKLMRFDRSIEVASINNCIADFLSAWSLPFLHEREHQ
jgi:hypothetical protein